MRSLFRIVTNEHRVRYAEGERAKDVRLYVLQRKTQVLPNGERVLNAREKIVSVTAFADPIGKDGVFSCEDCPPLKR
jgi:hypothetical protein